MRFNILIIVLIILTQCQAKKVSKVDLEGNWGCLLNDMGENVYTELYFHQDTLESFDRQWELHPMGKYKIQHDSLVTPTEAYKIDILDKNLINLVGEDDTIQMERINDGRKTIDFYINNGYFNKDFSDTIRKKALASFVDSIFIIREIEFKIKQGIENRDSLINYWESQLKSDSVNKTTYEYLIEKINKN